MAKNKLRRFAENLTFTNLFQPRIVYPPPDDPLKGNWHDLYFKNRNPIVLELGCGRGEYTVGLANKFPEMNFIGVDWKGARLWRGAKTAFEDKMPNVAFLRIQMQNLYAFFGPGEVGEIWITFPVPQMGKTDERKRVTSPRFLNLYRRIMSSGGIVHLKTDNRPLYDYTLNIIHEQKLELLTANEDVHRQHPPDEILSITTTYEKIWLKEGAKICYLKFKI
jgi:tRNA (guanine-N7-)-methyltransferase